MCRVLAMPKVSREGWTTGPVAGRRKLLAAALPGAPPHLGRGPGRECQEQRDFRPPFPSRGFRQPPRPPCGQRRFPPGMFAPADPARGGAPSGCALLAMARRPLLLLPLLPLLLPLQAGRASGSSPSVFRTTYTAVSEPGPGLPRFMAAAYVDDLPIARYDSDTGKVWYQAAWMERLLERHPEYQDKYEKMLQRDKANFTAGLGAVQATHNQSAGLHTWQMVAGCEVGLDRPRGRYLRFGYDGRDFLSLDVETFNWTAADATAQIMKRSWEANPSVTRRFRAYVEETCAEWSQAWLFYGKEIVRSKEPPRVTVTRRAGQDDTETLTCRAHGFYPREIDMVWTRDGEVWLQDTFRGVLTPNSDGTFHTWLRVRLDPWDRVRFLCRVEHDAFQTPVELAWEEPESSLGRLIWPVMGVLVLLPGIVLAVLYLKALCGAYRPASEILQGLYRDAKQHLQGGYRDAKQRLQSGYRDAKQRLQNGYRDAKQRLQEGSEEARQILQESYEEAEGKLGDVYLSAQKKLSDGYFLAFGILDMLHYPAIGQSGVVRTAAKRKLEEDLRKKFEKLKEDLRKKIGKLEEDLRKKFEMLEEDLRKKFGEISKATTSV